MSFAVAAADPQDPQPDTVPTSIEQEWWPEVSLDRARSVVRVNGTVSDDRLHESLLNATYSVNDELWAWSASIREAAPDGMPVGRLTDLYLRAVYFYAKAELVERYRDFDTTGAGERRAEELDGVADDSRRVMRWAISDLLGKPRTTIEAI